MVILLDLDNTLNDNLEKWLEAYNKDYNDKLTTKDIKTWNHHTYTKPECGEKFYDYLKQPGWFLNLDPLPGAQEFVQKLQDDNHQVYIVTACQLEWKHSIGEKMEWVLKYFPSIDKKHFITAHHKYLIKGDVLDDDGGHNAKSYKEYHPKALTVGFGYPYNKEDWLYYNIRIPFELGITHKTGFEIKYDFIRTANER